MSVSGQTKWEITDDGCLKESGPQSFQFTLSAVDTARLLALLESERDAIVRNAEREMRLSTSKHSISKGMHTQLEQNT